MVYYVPGTEEKDTKKVIMSLQQAHETTATNTTDIATNTANIATNTTNIAAVAGLFYDTRALAVAATVPGTINAIHLAGYTSAGDGGAANYKRVVSVTSGCIGFQSADGAWWQLSDLEVYPQMVGAKDDASAAADTQIQAAIDHVVTVGKGSVQLRGRFTLSAALSITGKVTIEGKSRDFTILYPDTGDYCIDINTVQAVVLSGFSIQYASPGLTLAISVTATNSNVNSVFRDLFISNCYIGIDFIRAAFFTVDNCLIACTNTGIRVANSYNVDEGDSIITNCFISGINGTTIGIIWVSSGGLKVSGNKIIDHAYGVFANMINSAGTVGGVSTAGLTFVNNNIEGCSNAAMDLRRQGSSAALSSVVINGGHSAGCPTFLSIPTDASAAWLTGLVVNGCSWKGQGSGSDVFATVNSVVGFSITGNCLQATSGTTYKIITGSAANLGVVGPNIGTGTFTASSISSTNTTTISPT
jgi:hypothetical protein